MKFEQLLQSIKYVEIKGSTDKHIAGITMDSRAVELNFVFVAVKGTKVNGENFITDAIEKGASVIVSSSTPSNFLQDVTYIIVENPALALGCMASAFFENPSRELTLVGVTGTNGKTTIATLLYRTFRQLGFKVGLLSTVANFIDEEKLQATHTTPDQVTVNSLLKRMVNEGCKYCFMEVSSHAIDQQRIAGLHFAGGIFTNLTHDHLDYHKDFKSYRDAKKTFFDGLPKESFSISNADDSNGRVMLQNTTSQIKYYSLQRPADFKGIVLENTMDGLHMKIDSNDVHFRLRGRFNAYNILAVYGAGIELGVNKIQLLEILSGLHHVEGRFDLVENSKGVYAVVDYAHTPDAVENILKAVEELRTRNEKLIVVIGAGGNRDKTKRPVMASISARFADVLILTSDNPRDENPEDILNDMKNGLDPVQLSKALIITDRYQALKTACALAHETDIVVVAGKGHENYQEINGVKHHFDDKEFLKEMLNS